MNTKNENSNKKINEGNINGGVNYNNIMTKNKMENSDYDIDNNIKNINKKINDEKNDLNLNLDNNNNILKYYINIIKIIYIYKY